MKLIKKSKDTKKETITEEVKVEKHYNNLSEVINHSLPFELIYSGVENDSYFEVLYNMGVRNFLMSFHYIHTRHLSLRERFKNLAKIRLFIDSGAHTYQNDPKYADFGVDYWEDHLKKYLKWAESNKDYIFAIANFDFENIVGAEVVNRWNRDYFEPFMLKTGIPVCFVWHQNSYADWEFYCKRYPYVGFSSVNTEGESITLNEYIERLRVAEKHDSVVHGFGMTRTSMLTEVPFYTSDSTTWLVGLQYGEMNYWNNNKMSRLKKDQWKTTYLSDICQRYDLSPDKMAAEDTIEMIKANVGAFIDAEKFVQDRLKSRMYWLKAKAIKVDVNNLPPDYFPSAEWLDSDSTEGLSEYCRRCNINPEFEGARDVLYDLVAFVNWNNPEYESIREWYSEPEQKGIIDDLHDLFINRIVSSEEEKIMDLTNFYTSCLSGECDKLLHIGTNFDRTVKERESYIEEDDKELVDMTEGEVRERLSRLLPDKSFEADDGSDITALDEEIYKQAEIVPMFDERGKFVKGCKWEKKPKKVYSKKYPKLACDTCMAAAKCPEYKSGYVCAYNKMFDRFSCRDMGDIIQSMQGIVEHNMTRMQKSMIMETINGTIDPVTTQLMDQNIRYMNMLKQMYECGSPEVLRQTKVLRADGSEETTVSVTNPQSGGIMEKLFGSMMSSSKKDEPEDKKEEDKEIIEVKANEQDTTDD